MRRFNFRLQKIMDIREKLKEIKKIELSKRAQEYNIEVMKLNNLKGKKEQTIYEMKQKITNGDFSMIDFYDKYIDSNNKLQRYQLESIKEKEKPFKKALNEYLEKDREVKVLKNYKEKLYKDYTRDVINEEQKIMDDLIGGRRGEEDKGGNIVV
jgi:flagellar FliJ protein